MSKACETFNHSIRDATDLLEHFDRVNVKPPPANAEVLKRASLVMTLTAFETYVEDRITEAVTQIASGTKESRVGCFYVDSLAHDLKYFHTPSADRVKPLFEKYLAIDITKAWTWNNYDPARARSMLNNLAEKRGDAVHRSPPPGGPIPTPHLVTREELRKNIQFIKDLVQATDRYLEVNL
jgi:hypothetical protein